MSKNRRQFIKGLGAVGALAAFGLGYSHTADQFLKGFLDRTRANDPFAGNAPQPEYRVDAVTGQVRLNPAQQVSYTVCMGCTTLCGVRVRIDKANDQVLRVSGNPYHTLSADPHLPYETSVLESFAGVSRHKERGLEGRATACARGNAVLAKLDSPQRVRVPLKRIGKRGAGLWAPISFEQLVEEVVEGGDLFREGDVEGLRAIRDVETPLDPEQPELGPKSNQMVFMSAFNDGRLAFAKRFAINSFGSRNFAGHRSYCGLSMRSGYAALLDNWKAQPHLKPDFANAEFLLFIGTSPGNAGNPFKRQGHLIAKGRSRGLKYVVVDPVLTNADNIAAEDNGRWLPIRPNTDGALSMGMIRWIIEQDAYDARFLASPNPAAATKVGEASWSNATHLVIVEPGADFGRMLRGSDLGLDPKGDDDPFVVADETGKLHSHTASDRGELFYQGQARLAEGGEVAVATSLALLREAAFEHTLAEYADACGIAEAEIAGLAREFTSHGKRAAVDTHGGTMGSNGFYAAYAIVMLNALIGNLNHQGGTSAGGGRFKDVAPGPRYNLATFKGMQKPKGVGLGRNGFPYEKTTEFRRKEAVGKPYPSEAPWLPLSPNMSSEFLPAMLNGYPYSAKALILWSTNPVYGVSGMTEQVKERLADPKVVPLIVSIDPFINESNQYADYIVPDSVLYESWGWASAWGGHLAKVNSARWPVVEPRQARAADGQVMEMESFLIAVGKRMGLPGYSAGAITDSDGNEYPIERAEDWYLRAAANIAFDGTPVPDASDDEIAATGVTRLLPELKRVLKREEWRKVAYLYARGGRFEDPEAAYDDKFLRKRYPRAMQLYNEQLALARNSLTGKRYRGTPYWQPPVLADGTPLEDVYPAEVWPLRVVSTKSQLQSSHTIGVARLQQIQPTNPIGLHYDDAAKLGVKTGDRIRVVSPEGSVEGIVLVRGGIQRGVIGIEHGFGHRELGARMHRLGENPLPKAVAAGAGVNHNELGCPEPHRPGITFLTDWVVGNVARQGLPTRIEFI
ncbi:molybdopterin dinucleotide binding domain-containing protein [Thiohalomonas denitrificans]|uniref:Tetrathionate reductase subunit A n=1 Tax=Thiohalomonas denitrificans TaxID=415747 RepID=A0A1G5QLQ1_9GAMM|nr:molybdopterin dinucleotide binding domain-containing protein [Thiohalomonas denitrificans]SCZ62764.1 tetrathionate reductase subunit A [Thiohalomonas denitrificans]